MRPLPSRSCQARGRSALPGVAFLTLMALGIARYRRGPDCHPAALVRDLQARARGDRNYLWLALLFGGLYAAWWMIGLLGLLQTTAQEA